MGPLANGSYIREDQFLIHAGVNGVSFPPVHSWQSKEGGDLQSEAVVTHPGGMSPAITLGGPNKRTDCTVKRVYTDTMQGFIQPLEQVCGNARMWVSYTPLDTNKVPIPNSTITITGILKEVQVPPANSNTAAEAVLGLVMSCDE